MEASGLVLMARENGMLTDELGSYEVEEGLDLVYKAYVEDGIVKVFLTIDRDVDDEEYNEIFDAYNAEGLEGQGFDVDEVDEEYNPVWCVSFKYSDEYSDVQEALKEITAYHKDEIERIYKEMQNNE